jgi:uncharacterized RDD family membrane protein YckC
MTDTRYVGFWSRSLASLIDSILFAGISAPLVYAFYGEAYFATRDNPFFAGPADILITWVLPIFLVIIFWVKKKGTPGKLALSIQVVDANTGENVTLKQSLIELMSNLVYAPG